jgi:hypothetical protein
VSEKPKYYARRWLNRRGEVGGAYIIAEVFKGKRSYNNAPTVVAELLIADCSRVVTLELDPSLSSPDNVRHKVAMLRDVVNGFCDTVEAELERAEALCRGEETP